MTRYKVVREHMPGWMERMKDHLAEISGKPVCSLMVLGKHPDGTGLLFVLERVDAAEVERWERAAASNG